MKILISTITLLSSLSLFAQIDQLESYQKKTSNIEHFKQAKNTGSNHTLLILGTAWDTPPELGDEIAIYNLNKQLVASTAWRPEQNGHCGLAIWGDDETTTEKEGMVEAESFTIVLFDKSEDTITELKVNQWERGNNEFSKDGVSVVSSISTSAIIGHEFKLFQNIPNPVTNNTSISFHLPEAGKIHLSISNSIGQELFTISNSIYSKGMHKVNMDASNLSTGVYFYKLVSNKRSLTKQLTIIK